MDEKIFGSFISQTNPYHRLRSLEFLQCVLSFGSLLSMLYDKKINIAGMFILILENREIRNLFVEIVEVDSDYEALLGLLQLYPSLLKSKNAKRAFQKSFKPNRTRKADL